MFDLMIKILPNGRVLVRNNASGESENLKASQVSPYIEKLLEEQLRGEEELDAKIAGIKEELEKRE